MPPADIVRLMPEDLEDLDKIQERPSSIKRIRDHHHLIARLIAQGRRTTDVAREVGMSISRISILKGDPAFRQLIETYRDSYSQIHEAVYHDVKKTAALLLQHTLQQRVDQYEEDPDSLSPEQVRADGEFAQSVIDDKITKVATIHGKAEDFANLSVAEQFELQSKRADRLIAPAHLPGSGEGAGSCQPAPPHQSESIPSHSEDPDAT